VARVTARADDGYVGYWSVTSYAICTGFIGAYETMTVVDTSTGAYDGVVGCPASTFVHSVGGGGSLIDSGPHYLQAVIPSSDLRAVYVRMTGPADGGMYIQAICTQ
jgi:hypothetical protein